MSLLKPILTCTLLLMGGWSFSQEIYKIDIQKEVGEKRVTIINRGCSFINEGTYKGIRLTEDLEDGIVWLKDFEFVNGTIEFDTRGKDVKQHSFVGIAFHGNDTTTFETIYLRPFNFKATQEPWRSRAIQYVARPVFTWQVLREKFPGKYENAITPAPEPDSWVHVRVVVQGETISVYINGSSNHSLTVNKLSTNKSGSVGLYVADTSGGDFANLTIMKTE
ncbi:MAG: family 16 glycoside hydrolase [Bacteroidota bacterium]